MMGKTTYKRAHLEFNMSELEAQNFLYTLASNAIKEGRAVTRVFNGTGRGKVLDEVILSPRPCCTGLAS